ncbi:3760_t:CDS:2 [Acaulospora morrowiae]|uniref:Putative gamma-glutamylcyclotransferase n=1 Tax=Acaulospora morrowiae TaxID=94023 RepID=A0A9N9C3G4_9GLOM|nr:3760_t:CDS:2 [Acaulospora morrowiae]
MSRVLPEVASMIFFFYGSLIFPKVLLRILQSGRNKNDDPVVIEEMIPATLKGYKRRKVLGTSYPAIIKDDNSETHGVAVKGLTPRDISILDHYEGDQYMKKDVEVFPINSKGDNGQPKGAPISAQTYVWIDSPEFLEDQDWDQEEFKKRTDEYLEEELRNF